MLAILGSMLLSAAAAQTAGPSNKNGEDPDQRVCKMVNEIGSRLSSHRTCMTRSEWAAQRGDTRTGIDRAQTRQFNLRVDELVKTAN